MDQEQDQPMDDMEIPTTEDVEDIDPKNLPTLVPIDQQRLSLYILTQRDRPIPSLESMKQFLDLSDDEANTLRIRELDEQYEEDLQRLYRAQAEEYLDDAEDRYYSLDENQLPNPDIEELYSRFRWEGCTPRFEWGYALHHTKSTYEARCAILQKEGAEQDANFPQSTEEYHVLKKEVKQHVACFLVLDADVKKEKMLTEYNWAWRQVQPLIDDFKTDAAFETEVWAIVDQPNVDDPRSARQCKIALLFPFLFFWGRRVNCSSS
ncbi:hypothetical protein C8J57DRAFT_671073 [Mycena rebaudengoi]|nr:hypothetical protein C8J57DRAFT_671073 [Mycena rebaudengoi]